MKKISLFFIFYSLFLIFQGQDTRMNVWYQGNLIYARNVVQIDSVNFEDYNYSEFTEITGGVTFKMKLVPSGTFNMGSTDGDADERPVHSVTLSDFYMAETQVTQQLWLQVMSNHSSTQNHGAGNNYPEYNVSWGNIVGTSSSAVGYLENGISYFTNGFCYKLSVLANGGTLGTKHYRLPTEAEWEFAARGGNQTHNYTYSGSDSINDVAWYLSNAGSISHPVAQKTANELGLYDMSGNLYEWCSDGYGSYSSAAQTNPIGAGGTSYRVVRGGSWSSSETAKCRVSHREMFTANSTQSNVGFRLALSY